MKFRSPVLGVALLIQFVLPLAPSSFAQVPETPADSAAGEDTSRSRQAIAWSQERLADLDATIAALEKDVAQRKGEAQAKAKAELDSLRHLRESYRFMYQELVTNAGTWTDTQVANAQSSLDENWNRFQDGVADYLDAVKADLSSRREVLDAELKARQETWRKSIDELRTEVEKLNAQERAALEARIDVFKAQVDESKKLLSKLQSASRESWDTMRKSYTEAQQLFWETYASIRHSMKDATKTSSDEEQ